MSRGGIADPARPFTVSAFELLAEELRRPPDLAVEVVSPSESADQM